MLPNIRAGLIRAFILAHVERFFDPTIASVSVLLMVLTVTVTAVVERTPGLSFMARSSP